MDRDTHPARRQRYLDLLRAMTPEQKLRQVCGLVAAGRAMAEAGIRQRHPGADDREVRVRLCVRLYGRDAAQRLFGDVPDDAL